VSFPQRSAAPQLREQLGLREGYGCDTCFQCLLPKGFTDPVCLLAECEKRKLEGIVSKRRDAPYRSSDHTDWIKVKSQSWREANKDRWRLFEESRRAARSSNGR
jgi:hypothetical protein